MKKKIVLMTLALVLVAIAGTSVWLFQPVSAEADITVLDGDPNNGAYLARMAGCIACHTDTESGNGPLAGGPELNTPFGTFAAPNLTQSEQFGIGHWSIEDFAVAVRQGVSPEGEPYYPAFPYEFYSSLSDQDIADLWAAFQTVPAIDTPDPEQSIQFPFSIRSGVKGWQAAFAEPVSLEPEPDQSEAYNRGKYIVEGPAHCAACHTPRNSVGALQVDQALLGSTSLPEGGSAPPIDAASLREQGWTQEDLAFALQTGTTPDGDALGGSMGEVILGGTQFLSWQDLMAMAEYLLTEK